jgi:hypothetical protein
LPSPFRRGITEGARYNVKPRPSRSFHTATSASDLFQTDELATLTWLSGHSGSDPDQVGEIALHMPVAGGRFDERCSFTIDPHLRPTRFERTLHGHDGRALREERVDFSAGLPKLPEATYPETLLPFIMGAQPLDGERRSLYAWICDRFVAKVYYEVSKKKVDVRVPAGHFQTTEVIMYPDLNDWVHLGSVLTRLSRPFLPKYHSWFEPSETGRHRLVRFEGPYGPPGAPEIVLELVEG